MEVYLDNIGIIRDSTININGITVITGINNAGKTTAGRAVYSVISASEDYLKDSMMDRQIHAYVRVKKFLSELAPVNVTGANNPINGGNVHGVRLREVISYNDIYDVATFIDKVRDFIKSLINAPDDMLIGIYKTELRFLGQKIISMRDTGRLTQFLEELNKLEILLSEDQDGIKYVNRKIYESLRAEMHDQILPIRYRDNRIGKIIINDGGKRFNIEIAKNKLNNEGEIFNPIAQAEIKKVIMIEQAQIIDDMALYRMSHLWPGSDQGLSADNFYQNIHQESRNTRLVNMLLSENTTYQGIQIKEKMGDIIAKLERIFPDRIILSGNMPICAESKLDVRNMAAGTKVFAVIKQLLQNGHFDENTLLILDEPDSHLHPEWQIILADVLVEIHARLGVKLLLTTHSFDFLYALEMATKRSIKKMSVYETIKQDDEYSVRCIYSGDNIKDVYARLGAPLQRLRREEVLDYSGVQN